MEMSNLFFSLRYDFQLSVSTTPSYFTELAYINSFPHNFKDFMALGLYFLVKIMAVIFLFINHPLSLYQF